MGMRSDPEPGNESLQSVDPIRRSDRSNRKPDRRYALRPSVAAPIPGFQAISRYPERVMITSSYPPGCRLQLPAGMLASAVAGCLLLICSSAIAGTVGEAA